LRIITNPGLNLTAEEIERHRVTIMPQRIMVDGVEHDTRSPVSFAEIDRWMREAKQPPHIVGTTAAEFVDVFRRLAPEDPELLVVTASKKLVGTNQAATSAARTFATLPSLGHARVAVVDCLSVDVAGALTLVRAAELAERGAGLDAVARDAREFAAKTEVIAIPMILDNLVKGGRATFLRALVANTLGVSPLIGFVDGEMRPLGTAKRADVVAAARDHVLARVGKGRKLWVGIGHGGDEALAKTLATELQNACTVERLTLRPLCATTYLNIGPRSLAVSFTPRA
jgi:DegV family protein with EDD domain